MKKIGIITIIDNENCGNRLQNYALQEVIRNFGYEAITIKNEKLLNSPENYFFNYLRYIKKKLKTLLNKKKIKQFYDFNKNITFSKKTYTCKTKKLNKKFSYFIVGSDQVWKPTRKRLSYIDLLEFSDNNKRIAYAASFGIDEIDEESKQKLQQALPKFRAISVREEAGKKIIEESTNLKDIEIVLDPTLLIDKEKWISIEKNPFRNKKENYIFSYFLGEEDLEYVKNYCNKNNIELINFYEENKNYGPAEFLYLINHAKIILTDSFHGSVFSIIFNKPFLVFERKEKTNNNNMNSRIETLLKTFELKDQKFSGTIEEENYNIDYSKVNDILIKNQKKSKKFLEKVLVENNERII